MAEQNSEYQIIKNNIEMIINNAKIAAERVGRSPESVKILAATKTVSAEKINFVCDCGIRYIGENRVQELLEKYDALAKDKMSVHFIGSLQTNKVKYIIDKVDMIHSVDSFRLASEISRQALKHNKKMDVLIEVNIANEPTKAGVSPEGIYDLLEQVSKLEGICVKGLMAIPPAQHIFNKNNNISTSNIENEQNSQNVCNCREYFRKIQQLFLDISRKKLDNIFMQELSLGMSEDYSEAIEEGSTIIRPGRAIFGERKLPKAE